MPEFRQDETVCPLGFRQIEVGKFLLSSPDRLFKTGRSTIFWGILASAAVVIPAQLFASPEWLILCWIFAILLVALSSFDRQVHVAVENQQVGAHLGEGMGHSWLFKIEFKVFCLNFQQITINRRDAIELLISDIVHRRSINDGQFRTEQRSTIIALRSRACKPVVLATWSDSTEANAVAQSLHELTGLPLREITNVQWKRLRLKKPL